MIEIPKPEDDDTHRFRYKKTIDCKPNNQIFRWVKEGAVDKATELIVRAIYDDMKKEDSSLDWYWIKHEAEELLAGKSPSGSVGKSVYDHLKTAGKL